MASRRLPLRTTTLVVGGVAGVVLAHGLDYLLVLRSPAQRALELARTGHGWWPSAVGAAPAAAIVAGGMAMAGGATCAVLRRTRGAVAAPATAGARVELASVAAWQAGLFGGLEVVERIGAHRSPVELLHGPLFALGLLLQVAVAAVVVAALRGLERAAAGIAGGALAARGRRRTARRRAFGPSGPALAAGEAVFGRCEARAPPLSVAS